jgi:hypothetical protein
MAPMTGDTTTDNAIKALQVEMETKIKAIRDEYQTKIKAAIGDKKIINRPLMASSTQRDMMRREEGERPMMQNGSTSESRPRPAMMGRNEGQINDSEVSQNQTAGSGVFGFLRRMFSR